MIETYDINVIVADEELGKLQDEFLKHQQKLDEYEQMKEKLAELESK